MNMMYGKTQTVSFSVMVPLFLTRRLTIQKYILTTFEAFSQSGVDTGVFDIGIPILGITDLK